MGKLKITFLTAVGIFAFLFGFGQTTYEANLTGRFQNPPIRTIASGSVSATLVGNQLVVTGSFRDLTGKINLNVSGGAHIHQEFAGTNGSVSFSLTPILNNDSTGGKFESLANTFTLSSAQVAALEDHMFYVNIHSTGYPAGELRGQLLPSAGQHYFSVLNGENEVPSVSSGGNGTVVAELNGLQLTISGSFDDLDSKYDPDVAGGSHIHLGPAGMNGGIAFTLSPTLDSDSLGGYFHPDNNVFLLSNPQRDSLVKGSIYVNIHTEDEQGGEIRGQLKTLNYKLFMSKLSGIQEVPPVASTGGGMVMLKLTANELVAHGDFSGLRGDYGFSIAGGAHIHQAIAGRNGSIIHSLNTDVASSNKDGSIVPDSNVFILSEKEMTALTKREMYINIHSTMFASGELRGQIVPESDEVYFANLYGTNEIPPVMTDARGALIIEVRGTSISASGSFNGLESDYATNIGGTGSGAHLHMAPAGRNGGVEFTLSPQVESGNRNGVFNASGNSFSVSPAQLVAMQDRMIYVNVHSTDNMSGELRGQVLPLANAISVASLGGINEVDPVMSRATGAFILELHGDSLWVSGAFDSLEAKVATSIAGGAHIHMAGPSANGSVIFPLNLELTMDSMSGEFIVGSNGYKLTPAQKTAFLAEELYMNIHSLKFMSGELRGQVLNQGNMFPAKTSILSPTFGTSLKLQGDSAQEIRVTWKQATDPDNNEVVYIWQFADNSNFTDPFININTGNDTMFLSDFGKMDALLAANGVNLGDKSTYYHRVISSDGSVQHVGDAFTLEIERGVITGIESVGSYPTIAVFPNPATNNLNFSIPAGLSGNVQLFIIDGTGKSAIQRRISNSGNSSAGQVSVSVENLVPGIYFYRLISDEREYSGKVVIQK